MPNTEGLLESILKATPAPPPVPRRGGAVMTSKIEHKNDNLSVDLNSDVPVTDDTVDDFLISKGYNPDEWEVTGMRQSEWTMANGETGVSCRYTFKRSEGHALAQVDMDRLIEVAKAGKPHKPADPGLEAIVLAIGDMQYGKGSNAEEVDAAILRTLSVIDEFARACDDYTLFGPVGHIHVAWLGDHIEGFESQGGANVWRTRLTLTEQTRIVRRVMMYAVEKLAPLTNRLTMVAVPGNHGDAVRVMGKGVTRYDDSHDTEALIAVSEACKLNPEAYGHVEFYTPENDEMTVVLEVGGAVLGHVHGHQWRPGKHWEWWKGQAFGEAVGLEKADVLLAGHLHHLKVEQDGARLFIQAMTLESESTWFRHLTGTPGNPGAISLHVWDGQVQSVTIIRGEA